MELFRSGEGGKGPKVHFEGFLVVSRNPGILLKRIEEAFLFKKLLAPKNFSESHSN